MRIGTTAAIVITSAWLCTAGATSAWAACGVGVGGGAPAPTVSPPPVENERPAADTRVDNSAPSVEVAPESTRPTVRRVDVSPRWALLGAGLGLYGATWLGSGVAAGVNQTGYLAIPLAGPFVQASRSSGAGTIALLSIDGVLQVGGLAMLIAGALTHKPVPQPLGVAHARR